MRVCSRCLLAAVLVLFLVGMAGLSAAQGGSAGDTQIRKSALVEKLAAGEIDWGAEMFYASGEGAMPSPQEEPNRARAKLKAKEYAKMQAIANLLQLIEGTSISYEATGKDYMVQDATLRQKIEGYVKNVHILRSSTVNEEGNTIVKVIVGTPMYGKDTPGSALLQKMSELALQEPTEENKPAPVTIEIPKEAPKPVQEKIEKVAPAEPKAVLATSPQPKPGEVTSTAAKAVETKPVPPKPVAPKPAPKQIAKKHTPPKAVEPKPAPVVAEAVKETSKVEPKTSAQTAAVTPAAPPEVKTAVATTAESGESYSSAIVDTLGFNVLRTMSPKIRTSNGDEVWGTLKMDPDVIQDHGPVAYTRTLADARKCPRAGSNPLVLRAIGRAGGSRMCDAVLSDDDVAKLKQADQTAKPPFLAELKVVFVVDPTRAF